jgi:signal peptidase I
MLIRDMASSRVLRKLLVAIAISVVLLLVLIVLDRADLLTEGSAGGTSSMAPTLPPCNGRTIAEGFTYRFRDPHRGEIVVFHARGHIGGTFVPDPESRELAVNKRVIGVPGDTVSGHAGRVFVNGKKADDIVTEEGFSPVHLTPGEYFLLGDNRSYSQDSRVFGPVDRKAIFARVVLIYWPLGRFGLPGYKKTGTPPGPACHV